MTKHTFSGTGVAIVTPFLENGELDKESLEKLIAHLTNGGVNYLVVLGTTGENATLYKEEKQEIHHKIDILGLFYLSIFLTALMFFSYFIGVPHQKDETLISAAFTILFGVLFIFHAFFP